MSTFWLLIWVATFFLAFFWWFITSTKDSATFVLTEGEREESLKNLNVKAESSARKMWLIAFFFEVPKNVWLFLNLTVDLAPLITWSLFIGCWSTFYCAYIKRGAGFILLPIISFPLTFFCYWPELGPIGNLIYFVIRLFYWISCIRLFRVNAAHETQLLLALRKKYGVQTNAFYRLEQTCFTPTKQSSFSESTIRRAERPD